MPQTREMLPKFGGMIFAKTLQQARWYKLKLMRPFIAMADAALLDFLTDYYSKYRVFVKDGGDKIEFENCRDTLVSLLLELNLRLGRFNDFHYIDSEQLHIADPV